MATLRKLGGELVQGFYYSPPISAGEIPGYLTEQAAVAKAG
jgi:EAL domain-containing protein (putative c-di-GMP-specific phosphodiesterase class I)